MSRSASYARSIERAIGRRSSSEPAVDQPRDGHGAGAFRGDGAATGRSDPRARGYGMARLEPAAGRAARRAPERGGAAAAGPEGALRAVHGPRDRSEEHTSEL